MNEITPKSPERTTRPEPEFFEIRIGELPISDRIILCQQKGLITDQASQLAKQLRPQEPRTVQLALLSLQDDLGIEPKLGHFLTMEQHYDIEEIARQKGFSVCPSETGLLLTLRELENELPIEEYCIFSKPLNLDTATKYIFQIKHTPDQPPQLDARLIPWQGVYPANELHRRTGPSMAYILGKVPYMVFKKAE